MCTSAEEAYTRFVLEVNFPSSVDKIEHLDTPLDSICRLVHMRVQGSIRLNLTPRLDVDRRVGRYASEVYETANRGIHPNTPSVELLKNSICGVLQSVS